MRKVGNFKNAELSSEEYLVLVDFLGSAKNLMEIESLLKILLTESELAVISQRLAILRMITKKFTYNEIEERLKVATNTIAKIVNSKSKEKSLENIFDEMIKRYRYNPEKIINKLQQPSKSSTTSEIGIRSFLREEEKLRKKHQSNKND
ncbi:MAG: Trp family transcriptional regulator [Candidatus Berkelbacteria bacterium]|nr:Trp family transcriptional regulator [Candidatus Berkelbacteria bacterium]